MLDLCKVSIISAVFGFALSCNVFATENVNPETVGDEKAVETTQPVVDTAKDVSATTDKKVVVTKKPAKKVKVQKEVVVKANIPTETTADTNTTDNVTNN